MPLAQIKHCQLQEEYLAEGVYPTTVEIRERFDPAFLTLSTILLVQRSWTWPAQKAMGRQIIVSNGDALMYVRKAITSPLHGLWTTRALISYTGQEMDPELNQHAGSDALIITSQTELDKEFTNVLVELIKRMPSLRQLSFKLQTFSDTDLVLELYTRALSQFALLKRLNTVVVLCLSTDLTPSFGEALVNWLAELPILESLFIDSWESEGCSALLADRSGPYDASFPGKQASLERLKICLHTNIPTELLIWLFKPSIERKGKEASQIQNLELIVLSSQELSADKEAIHLLDFMQAVNAADLFAPSS